MGANQENEIKLKRNEMKMVRWMVGTKLIERVPSKELRQRLEGRGHAISVKEKEVEVARSC